MTLLHMVRPWQQQENPTLLPHKKMYLRTNGVILMLIVAQEEVPLAVITINDKNKVILFMKHYQWTQSYPRCLLMVTLLIQFNKRTRTVPVPMAQLLTLFRYSIQTLLENPFLEDYLFTILLLRYTMLSFHCV